MYTYHVGEKFHADGDVRTYPGNTVICFANPDDAPYQEAVRIQHRVKDLAIFPKVVLMPPSSLHMTVMGLLLDAVRTPDYWTRHLPLTTPLAETDCYFIKQLATIPLPDNFRMRFGGFGNHNYLSFDLVPADEETHQAIWRLREAIAQASGVREPDFADYGFHMTLGYNLQTFTEAEQAEFDRFKVNINAELQDTFGIFNTGKPHLTFFDDMFRFATLSERHTLHTRPHRHTC